MVQKSVRDMAAMPIMFIWSRGPVYSAAKHENTGVCPERYLKLLKLRGSVDNAARLAVTLPLMATTA